jgi:hypothetical protein
MILAETFVDKDLNWHFMWNSLVWDLIKIVLFDVYRQILLGALRSCTRALDKLKTWTNNIMFVHVVVLQKL